MSRNLLIALLILMMIPMCNNIQAQSWSRSIARSAAKTAEKKAKQRAEKEVNKQIEKAVDEVADQVIENIEESEKERRAEEQKKIEAEAEQLAKDIEELEEAMEEAGVELELDLSEIPEYDNLTFDGDINNIYFPSKEGMKLKYADKNAKGKITGYTEYHIIKVNNIDDKNYSISYLLTIYDEKNTPTLSDMEVIVKIINGVVHFDGSSYMASLAEGMEIKGNGISIPANIEVGQKLKDFSVTIESLATTNTCTNVIVAAEEKITVDNAVLDTHRIDMDTAGKALFIKYEGKISQWYAKGIGEVKTINYDKKGKVSTTRELISINH
ncbi:hypothetical protein LJC73_06635 [Bacteroidales bacterium OttesenSCG-928-L14]|nr:hypothetical protein [Bacteroidales bacterium OttesenSCG-928-L14]